MQLGVVFPQTEIGGDVDSVRRYAEGVEAIGYRHLLAYDHVVGADPSMHHGWTHKYTSSTTFHETMVLFGFLAGLTRLELATGVVVLPQRQTVLCAKQAAEVDLLSDGRFRLGVAVGWNAVEYAALGADFSTRGRRLEEQVALLRALWTRESVSFEGVFDRVDGVAIAPLPIQRPIPVWLGASSAPAFRRVGRIADGWFPHLVAPGETLDDAKAIITAAAIEAGRTPDSIGMEARATWAGSTVDLVQEAERWRDAGASHLSIDTMEAGLPDAEAHLDVLREVYRQLT